MTTSPPTEKGTLLSPEQRRRLGEVYRLILSWQPGDKKTREGPKELLSHPVSNHLAVSPDRLSGNDNSKGGANG